MHSWWKTQDFSKIETGPNYTSAAHALVKATLGLGLRAPSVARKYQQPYEETAIPLGSNVFQVVQSISDLEERLKASITVDIQKMQDEIVNTLNRASNMNIPSTDEN